MVECILTNKAEYLAKQNKEFIDKHTPILSITQDEYDRLSEEEKQKDLVYLIDSETPATVPYYRVSNQNLLDNWYFGSGVINQRGQTEYLKATYTIDRWYSSNSRGIVTIEDGFIRLSTNGLGTSFLRQIVDKAFEVGTKLTVSALVKNTGHGYLGLIYVDDNKIEYTSIPYNVSFSPSDKWQLVTFTQSVPDSTYIYPQVVIRNNNNPTDEVVDIKAIKLELGDKQTLAHQDINGNWILNDTPPNEALERAKCQRYQNQLIDPLITGQAYIAKVKAINATNAYGIVPLPVTMRDGMPTLVSDCSEDTPYVSFGLFTDGYRSNSPITNMSVYSKMQNGIILKVIGSDFVQGNEYQVYVTNSNQHSVLLERNL